MNFQKRRSIKTRIVWGFSFFALLTAALFSMYNFFFAYLVEDEFFDRLVKDEAQYLIKNGLTEGTQVLPRLPFISIHPTPQTLPDDIRTQYLANPAYREFAGDQQRHYHLFIPDTSPSFILVAEVSDYLVVRPRRSNILIFLATSTGVMLLISAIFGYWVAIRTTRPLSRLAELVEQTKPSQLPKQFANDFPNDEIGILANSLEQAMLRIQDFIEREQHFTRDASHELRTPIAIIKGSAELLEKRAENQTSTTLIKRISDATIDMEQVITTLLLLAREPQNEKADNPIKLLPIIEQSVIKFSPLLKDKPIKVEVDIKESISVNVSTSVCKIIVDNVISNAFQYTQHGLVLIGYSDKGLFVSDTGTGLEAEIEESLLEPFVKGKNSQGFGIGLSIVKRLCEKYQISLEVQNGKLGVRIDIGFQ